MMRCKRCGIGYGNGRCHGMFGIGSKILLCDNCHKKWKAFYRDWINKKFPDGIPFYWLNWSEEGERDKLFLEWVQPKTQEVVNFT